MNSREKGARFERTLAKMLRDRGYDQARRGQQYCGANGDADVVGLPFIHIEAKAVEKLNLYDAMEQSKADSKGIESPVVIHKKNNKPVLVTMEFDTFMKLYEPFKDSMGYRYPSVMYQHAGFPHWYNRRAEEEREELYGEDEE